MTNAASVKDRLKMQVLNKKVTMQDQLVTFALERAIYRISISEYADRFTLKGGIFLYALFNGDYARATVDIDLLAWHLSNDIDEMRLVFTKIFSIACDDAIRFDLMSLDVRSITEFKKYHGVNVSIIGFLDRTRIPVSIDIGFDDVIYPQRTKMTFPVLLDMEAPTVYAYSLYSVIAEKFEAFVSLGLVNGRYKDFYDIYVLANQYEFAGTELKEACIDTFNHRKTKFEDIVVFETDFSKDEVRVIRWNSFVKKKKALTKVGFDEVIKSVRRFLKPVSDSIVQNDVFLKTWNPEKNLWVTDRD